MQLKTSVLNYVVNSLAFLKSVDAIKESPDWRVKFLKKDTREVKTPGYPEFDG